MPNNFHKGIILLCAAVLIYEIISENYEYSFYCIGVIIIMLIQINRNKKKNEKVKI